MDGGYNVQMVRVNSRMCMHCHLHTDLDECDLTKGHGICMRVCECVRVFVRARVCVCFLNEHSGACVCAFLCVFAYVFHIRWQHQMLT